MTHTTFEQGRWSTRLAGFGLAAICAIVAIAGIVILLNLPQYSSDRPASPAAQAAISASEPTGYVSRDPSLPDASEVFKDRRYEASVQIEQF